MILKRLITALICGAALTGIAPAAKAEQSAAPVIRKIHHGKDNNADSIYDAKAEMSQFATLPYGNKSLMDEKVIVGNDTVSIIIPQRNFGRYDRGLYNFLFIPKGQWAFGLLASYGEFDSDDVQLLSVIKDFNFKGKQFSIKPSVSYFIRNNQSLGIRFNYTRGEADLSGLNIDFDDDLNFSLKDVSYYSNHYSLGVFYRNYVGLGSLKRFAVFNDVDLSFGSGSSRFQRSYDGLLHDTHTTVTECSLNFSPGVCMFIMDNVSFNVSFGVFGLRLRTEKQRTYREVAGQEVPDIDTGSRFSSGANFKFNLFNINFGLGVHI